MNRWISGVGLAMLAGPLLGCTSAKAWVAVLDVENSKMVYTHAPARPASFAFNDEECLFIVKPVDTGMFAPNNPEPHRFDAIEVAGGFATASPPGSKVRAYIGDRSESFNIKTAGLTKQEDGSFMLDVNAENDKRRLMVHIEGVPGGNPEFLRGQVGSY